MPDGDFRMGARMGDMPRFPRGPLARCGGWLRRRDPFMLFLAVAAALFALYWVAQGRGEPLEVSRAAQRSLFADYALMTGHAPDAKARAKLVDDYIADEVLFREAVKRGMHLTDKATRERLTDRLRFMIAGAPAEPGEEQLVDYYAEHADLYRSEPRISMEHVFFQKPPADPAAILARLRAGGQVRGDDYWMGRILPDYGESMLRGMFGQPFLLKLRAAKTGEWFGPVASPRGVHFVRVTGRGAPARLPYAQMHDQVMQDYLASESGTLVDAEVAKLKEDYRVAVE